MTLILIIIIIIEFKVVLSTQKRMILKEQKTIQYGL